MFENSKNIVMRESKPLQLTNLFSIMVQQRGVFHQILLVRRSPIIVTDVKGKLSQIFTMIPVITPFDRGYEYCRPTKSRA